jgi:transposase
VRPPKALNESTRVRILAAIRKGMTLARAAECGGVSFETYRKWRKRGEAGEEPFCAFFAEVKEAERDAEEELLLRIREHSIETWQAAAWLLERRYPHRYGPPKQRLQHEVKPMTPEQAAARYRELTGHDWPGAK